MPLQAQTRAWYDRLATLQPGYRYPWRSHLDPWHGEDMYHELVGQHVQADMDVLDSACAQGEIALEIAPHCRSITGYDRIAAWIAVAQQSAGEAGFTNANFICHDLSAEAERRTGTPASRRGFV